MKLILTFLPVLVIIFSSTACRKQTSLNEPTEPQRKILRFIQIPGSDNLLTRRDTNTIEYDSENRVTTIRSSRSSGRWVYTYSGKQVVSMTAATDVGQIVNQNAIFTSKDGDTVRREYFTDDDVLSSYYIFEEGRLKESMNSTVMFNQKIVSRWYYDQEGRYTHSTSQFFAPQYTDEVVHTQVLTYSDLKNPFKDLPLIPFQFTNLARFTHGSKIPASWKAPDRTYAFELIGDDHGYPVEIRAANNATTSFILEYE